MPGTAEYDELMHRIFPSLGEGSRVSAPLTAVRPHQELVTTMARLFGLLDEKVYDAVINHSDEMAHIAKFYNLKSAS